ncbi:MAG: polymer-forming cytoskeletal protein [Desulfovibrionales bacterium]
MGKKKQDNELTGFLGAGTDYNGQLNFKGTLRIDGNFSGEIDSNGTLVVGEKALIQGPIKVGTLIASGRIVGDVEASTTMIVHKTARIEGSLKTPTLVLEEGAILKGSITMGQKSLTAEIVRD